MDHAGNHKRHRRVFTFLRYTISPVITRYLGYRFKKTAVGGAPAIIISNHTTDFDPILVASAFHEHMYFVASEHIFRWGFYSRLIKFFFAPIARTKGQADVSTALKAIRLLKKGYNVCIFAEGVRTLSGVSETVAPATGKLVKASGAQLITFRLEGGYFTTPAWGRGLRRGRMTGCFVNRYLPEDLKDMTADEITWVINRDIHEDAYESQEKSPVRYRGKTPAEHLEKVLYLCPSCQRLATLRSEGSSFFCGCGLSGVYNEYGGLEGGAFSFRTVTEWFLWQRQFLPELARHAAFAHSSRGEQLISISDETGAMPVAMGSAVMSREYFEVAGNIFPLSEISDLAIHSGTVLIFFHKGVHYEVRSQYPRSALLYRDLFYLFKELGPAGSGQV